MMIYFRKFMMFVCWNASSCPICRWAPQPLTKIIIQLLPNSPSSLSLSLSLCAHTLSVCVSHTHTHTHTHIPFVLFGLTRISAVNAGDCPSEASPLPSPPLPPPPPSSSSPQPPSPVHTQQAHIPSLLRARSLSLSSLSLYSS